MIADPSGLLSLLSSTPPCICPSIPIPTTDVPDNCVNAWRVACTTALHQRSGCCSVYPCCGTSIGYSQLPAARTRPASSITTTLTLDVPRSIPSSWAITIFLKLSLRTQVYLYGTVLLTNASILPSGDHEGTFMVP